MTEPGGTSAPFFPVSLDIRGRPCLVVGGGPVAARKAAALLSCGADVTVVAPSLSDEMERLAASLRTRWSAGPIGPATRRTSGWW